MADDDQVIEQLIRQYDSTCMPIPNLEHEPHLLISKVRKHYFDYLIKLLASNYETNQKLVNKNIYLPSAIWRCAKNLETSAAQMSMVVQLYRQSIISVVKELKKDTQKGKLNRRLFECLHRQPVNEKKLQTNFSNQEQCTCECQCKLKKRRKTAESLKNVENELLSQIPQNIPSKDEKKPVVNCATNNIPEPVNSQIGHTQKHEINTQTHVQNASEESKPKPPMKVKQVCDVQPSARMSVESHESDELMMQLEKLFQNDPNDEDIFDSALCDTMDFIVHDESTNKPQNDTEIPETCHVGAIENSVIENDSVQKRSLDERLASLSGLLGVGIPVTDSDNTVTDDKDNENKVTQYKADSTSTKPKKGGTSKWLCEEYFLKSNFFELLYEIGETNRKKLSRIKEVLYELFGDMTEEGVAVSPIEETPLFVISCKERIAPWVVKLLTPYYVQGRIRGKALFKALAKHLIRLIYQCSKYPREYEVQSFVTDFLDNHKIIKCEADFKQFRIDNL